MIHVKRSAELTTCSSLQWEASSSAPSGKVLAQGLPRRCHDLEWKHEGVVDVQTGGKNGAEGGKTAQKEPDGTSGWQTRGSLITTKIKLISVCADESHGVVRINAAVNSSARERKFGKETSESRDAANEDMNMGI